jgi:hypothetical protein
MKIVKKNNPQDDVSLCEFIESLEPGHLYWLITTPPLGDDILDHAMSCHNCAVRIEEAGEAEYTSLPLEERRQYRETALRILKREKEQQAAPGFVRERLAFAASDIEQSADGTADRVAFATFEVGGHSLEAMADAEGMVFLRGDLPAEARKLYFGNEGFSLKRGKDAQETEVEDLGSVDLEQFLERHHADPEGFPIRFGE